MKVATFTVRGTVAQSERWKRAADAKYQYVLDPLDAFVSGTTVRLRARLTGNFPGSPVEVDYIFTLASDRITVLDIK